MDDMRRHESDLTPEETISGTTGEEKKPVAPPTPPPAAPEQKPELAPGTDERVEIPARPVEVPEVSRPVAEERAEDEPAPSREPLGEAVYAYHWQYADQRRHDEEADRKRRRKGSTAYALIVTIAFAISLILLVGVLILDDVDHLFNERVVYVRELDEDSGVLTLQEIAEVGKKYTVAISVTLDGGRSVGTGIIMDEAGHIATNYHVVEDAKTIDVILYDGKTYQATYVGGDELSDLAVIKVEATGLTVAQFGDSDELLVGDTVVAIGTPAGLEYAGTTTNGIVSAINRSVKIYNNDGTMSKKMTLIQTNASVNHGNSGGPLIDEYGRVVGVVSMKLANGFENIGFAIPINGAREILDEIVETGEYSGEGGNVATKRAYLGITGVGVEAGNRYVVTDDGRLLKATVDDQGTVKIIYGDQLLLPSDLGIAHYTLYDATVSGVWVTDVDATKGAHGKVKVDDVIVRVEGKTVIDIYDVMDVVNEHNAGDTLELQVNREGKLLTVQITLSGE